MMAVERRQFVVRDQDGLIVRIAVDLAFGGKSNIVCESGTTFGRMHSESHLVGYFCASPELHQVFSGISRDLLISWRRFGTANQSTTANLPQHCERLTTT